MIILIEGRGDEPTFDSAQRTICRDCASLKVINTLTLYTVKDDEQTLPNIRNYFHFCETYTYSAVLPCLRRYAQAQRPLHNAVNPTCIAAIWKHISFGSKGLVPMVSSPPGARCVLAQEKLESMMLSTPLIRYALLLAPPRERGLLCSTR